MYGLLHRDHRILVPLPLPGEEAPRRGCVHRQGSSPPAPGPRGQPLSSLAAPGQVRAGGKKVAAPPHLGGLSIVGPLLPREAPWLPHRLTPSFSISAPWSAPPTA